MCGIAAIIGKNKQDPKELTKMLAAISTRGEKKYFDESAEIQTCVLGMNRLAIVDREHAKQPISSSDGRYSIVFNGEIYNYKELQKELVEQGYKFNTDSDTEVLVNGYAAWGPEVLQKLIGMYSFFIFDTQSSSFFAARDLFGVKPLYWAQDKEDTYYFASEIKSLSQLNQIEEVKLFPPAHYMKDGVMTQYWKIPTKINSEIKEDEAIAEIRKLFDEAIRIRVQTDLPIAVYMSGGIDSTAVLATAAKYHNDVTAIIVGNDESSDKQTAIRYCEEKKIKYVVKVPPTEEELVKDIPWAIKASESFEPNMVRQVTLSRYIALAAAEKGFKVILCGEGSDEIFAGYPEFTQLESNQKIEERITKFLSDLHRTQLQRVDRTSMAFTTEVREPFLDKNLVEYVLQISADLKVKKVGEKVITKYILRKAMEDRLSEYIYNRDKVVLSEGAGYKGNQKIGGLFYDFVAKEVSDSELEEYKTKYKDWNLETKEEVYYFKYFLQFGYGKARFNQERTMVSKTNTYVK